MKKSFDLMIILLFLPFIILVYCIVVLLVGVKLELPILFKQTRPGLNGKTFNILKFRTITNEFNANGGLLS